jgi:hypothetical protein
MEENCVKKLVGKTGRKSHRLQDVGLYVRIILKLSLERLWHEGAKGTLNSWTGCYR